MKNSASTPTVLRVSAVCALLAGIGSWLAACSANRNHEQRERQADRDAAEAEGLGVIDYVPCGEDGQGTERCCVGDCTPDPGSAPVDCAKQEEGIEFMSPAIWDFEGSVPSGGLGSTAEMYTYTDRSVFSSGVLETLQVPGRFMYPRGYQPDTEVAERCGVQTNAFHLRGGIFRNYGGGIGRSLKAWPGVAGLPQPTHDISEWDGISLWARRGPNGQAQLRVGVGDPYTDDDLNRAEVDSMDVLPAPRADGKLCRRARACDCPSGTPCSRDGSKDGQMLGGTYCYDPATQIEPLSPDEHWARCEVAACNYTTTDGDGSFEGKACTPHLTQSGEMRKFCFDKGLDPDPPESHEQCGDHWMSGIHLTADWQLFLIPFTSMQQQGFGMNAPRLMTDAISMVRMSWESGWIDFWIDDVRFYRRKR
jgi:hypothetical protein